MGLKELTKLIAKKKKKPLSSHSHVGCSSLNIEGSGESEGSDQILVSAYIQLVHMINMVQGKGKWVS